MFKSLGGVGVMALKTDKPKVEWIKFRIEPELKDAWREWLAGQNESQVFRDVMRKLIGKEAGKIWGGT
jgi:hypothetical protein